MSLAWSPAEIEPASTVLADLSFIVPSAEKPRTYTYDPPDGSPRSNTRYTVQRVPIEDARPFSQIFSLDREGFELV